MKEIGGYFELECRRGGMFHNDAHRLNSGRSALRVIIESLGIDRIHVPKFTCPVVWDAIKDAGAKCCFYDVDENFLPQKEFPANDHIIYTNYFGCCARQTRYLASKYPDLIIDNAQAFYMPDAGLASIYSPRKFFGIPDGGMLYCRRQVELPTRKSVSWDRCRCLLKRYDLGAAAGYDDFKKSSISLCGEGTALMSNLTEAMMRSIDYDGCAKQRIKNFKFLHRELKDYNRLEFSLTDEDIPMVYPFLSKSRGLREHLIENKIYVASYWPGVGADQPLTAIVPLPIDQRYGEIEMTGMADVVKKYIRR